MYGRGISFEGDVLDLAVEMKIVDKSGAWFNYGSERLGQGREKARDYLKENREVLAKIEAQVREQAATKRVGANAQQDKDTAVDDGAADEE